MDSLCDRLGLSIEKWQCFQQAILTAWMKERQERQNKSKSVRELFQGHPTYTLYLGGKKIKVKQGVTTDRRV